MAVPSSSAWARASSSDRRPSASQRAMRSGSGAGAGPSVTTGRNLAAKIVRFLRHFRWLRQLRSYVRVCPGSTAAGERVGATGVEHRLHRLRGRG
jgi:hypothetical protein